MTINGWSIIGRYIKGMADRKFDYFLIMLFFVSIFFCGCKKFVEVGLPSTQVETASVFTSEATAVAAIRGIYSQMISSSGIASGGLASVANLTGLSSDEFINYTTSPDYIGFYTNSISPTNSTLQTSLWGEGYQYIYDANAIIAGLAKSSNISDSVKNQLLGEAKFIRAFFNFYLVNLFGDIPLVTSTDYNVNSKLARTPARQVYQTIIADLQDADSLMANDYSFSNGERVRPNKWVAIALLARVYLYTNDWPNAEAQSTLVINNSGLFQLDTDLNAVFLANSTEAIWQLLPVTPGENTNEGNIYILTSDPSNVSLSNKLLGAFEPGDNRMTSWVNSYNDGTQTYYYPFKYKIQTGSTLTEYSMVFRLAEQYLIRSEARAEQHNLVGGAADLNTIRTRAGLDSMQVTSQSDLLTALLHENQIEFFSEWGHRWLDLKRTNSADSALAAVKAPNWEATDVLYPIPQLEIQNDPNLTQNAGY
jgi:hypothetical protein